LNSLSSISWLIFAKAWICGPVWSSGETNRIIILTGLLIYFIFKNKQKEPIDSNVNVDSEIEYSFKGLSERQKEIVQLLIDTKRPLTQVEIQKELDMPKAAVSRNVHSLEIKGLIEIEKIGMSNLIRLKKP